MQVQARPQRSWLWNRCECVCVHVKGSWENGWLSNSRSLTNPLQPFSHFHTNCFQITQTLPVSQSKPTSDALFLFVHYQALACLDRYSLWHTQTRSARNPAGLRMQGLGRVAPNVCMFFLKMGLSQQGLSSYKFFVNTFPVNLVA